MLYQPSSQGPVGRFERDLCSKQVSAVELLLSTLLGTGVWPSGLCGAVSRAPAAWSPRHPAGPWDSGSGPRVSASAHCP